MATSVRRLVVALLVVGCLVAGGAPDDAGPAAPRTFDLVSASWTRDGAPHAGATVVDGVAGPAVRLPFDATGVRWAFRFETTERTTWRLLLDWEPGPDGLLFELVIDGERLSPPRDGWRPSARQLLTDLGPRWLGQGDHLIEFVARENRPDAQLVLRTLKLTPP